MFKGYGNINTGIPLIESECKPERKMSNNLFGTTYQKSPFRDRQNRMNLGNTPNRSVKASLSPLRSRRTQSSMSIKSGFHRNKPNNMEYACINEPNKVARFVAYTDDQPMYYCQKCAILLASQGFQVTKLSIAQSFENYNSGRQEEVDQFLSQLDTTIKRLYITKNKILSKVSGGESLYNQQIEKIETYYAQFYEIIDEHKRRVVEEMKDQFENCSRDAKTSKQAVEKAIEDSQAMKDDIISSITTIYETDQQHFRPIMDNYHRKTTEYNSMQNIQLDDIEIKKLEFNKDIEQICNALEEGLQVSWEEENGKMDYSKQSQNPIEIVEAEQRNYNKSSLKEIGNLFSSFEE